MKKREKDWIPAGNDLVAPIEGYWPHNFCLNVPASVVGRLMLKRLDKINEQRRHQARRFIGALLDYPELDFQHVPDHCEHAYHLMAARFDGKNRDGLFQLMCDKYMVEVIVQYWPLHRSSLFKKMGLGKAVVPETDHFYGQMISFPWWSDMSDELLDEMADRTRKALDEMRSG